jgi:hypothetical protein
MIRATLAALAAALLLIFMLLQIPGEIAVLSVIDDAVHSDGGSAEREHDLVPDRIRHRLEATSSKSTGPCLFAGDGVIALHCPHNGHIIDIKQRASGLIP